VINNAMTPTRRPFTGSSAAQWDRIDARERAQPLSLRRGVVPLMAQRGGGSIVNVSSHAAAHETSPYMPEGYLIYCVAKAALERFSTALAPEVRPQGVAVNALRPGAVRTEGTEQEFGPDFDWKGWQTPDALVAPIATLAAPRTVTSPAAYSTSQDSAQPGPIRRDLTCDRGPAPLRHRAARDRAVRPAAHRPHVRVRDHPLRLDAPRPRRAVPHVRPPDPAPRGARPRGADGAQTSPTSTTRSCPRLRELGVPYLDLAAAETARFRSDMAALEMRPPVAEAPGDRGRAAIIDCVGRLLDKGNAYISGGSGVLRRVDVPRVRESSRTTRGPDDQARAVAGRQPRRSSTAARRSTSCCGTVAQRRARVAGTVGAGRPGWHIECSCMALHEHGPTIDLHGGGTDLIFPHHECEIAQSESLTGEPLSRHWMHSAMVQLRGREDVEVARNLVFVSDLLKVADSPRDPAGVDPSHYRSGFEWYDTDLDEAVALLHRLLAAASKPDGPDPTSFADRVRDAIDSDLDAPRALEHSTTSPARSSPAAPTRARPKYCASSGCCWASTSPPARIHLTRGENAARSGCRASVGLD